MSGAQPSTEGRLGQRGRYTIVLSPLAVGGMASLHLARRAGALGVVRVCALKSLHPHIARDAEVVAMLLDEACIHSVHVPGIIEIATDPQGVLLAAEYVHGATVSELRARCATFPFAVAVTIAEQTLDGLHAAHEARGDEGRALDIVHRDVSPQNLIVGFDGIVRVVDFGIARASRRAQTTELGQVKGKFGWMAPEQLAGGAVDRRADLYAVAVILWEMLAGHRLFVTEGEALRTERYAPLRSIRPEVPERLDAIVRRALDAAPEGRFASAREMLVELRSLALSITPDALARWTCEVAADLREDRGRMLALIRSAPAVAPETEADHTAGAGITRSMPSGSRGVPERRGLHERGLHERRGLPERSLVAVVGVVGVAALAVASFSLIVSLRRADAPGAAPTSPSRAATIEPVVDDPPGPIERSDCAIEAETVRDGTTGLEWQRIPPSERFTYEGAARACAELSLGGRGGFRVPSRAELLSIVVANVASPSVAHDAFPRTPPDFFWSSTPAAELPGGRWSVLFSDGAAARRVDGLLAVRCVRGGRRFEGPRFRTANEEVIDARTALRWERATCETLLDEQGAVSWCAARKRRLPTVLELESIVDARHRSPAIDAAIFPETPPETFWSSTDNATYARYGWSVSFDTGEPRYALRDTLFRVRCVASL